MCFFEGLDKENIRWFVLRGYQGLPDHNPSKDVDIMIEVGKESKAAEILHETFREAGLTHIHSDAFGHIHCYIGINAEEKFAIHIDLVEGYISKGFEVLTFDELYQHVVKYNGINVLDDFMNGMMLLIYKIFGYRNAKLKQSYQDDIAKTAETYEQEFRESLKKLVGDELTNRLCELIAKKDFCGVIALEREFTRKLKHYTFFKRPFTTIKYVCEFFMQKVCRIVFNYRKYAKTFAVIAPDGTGKTTFLDSLIELMNFYYVNDGNDNRFHVYHFRPEIMPNLGKVGERAGVMKQDVDFTNPHRSKPANPISSLFRISYYTLDYILGWQKCVRNDVHYDRYTVFDRYSYDFIVDPLRTKLNLPESVRRFFVALTPQPKIVFVLDADPEIIFARKQELELDEIRRQVDEYRKLAKRKPSRFKVISAEKTPDEMAEEAAHILLGTYTNKL